MQTPNPCYDVNESEDHEAGSAKAMSDTLHVHVQWVDEAEGDAESKPYYLASFDEFVGITQGYTWEELVRNVFEVAALALDGEDPAIFGLSTASPRILLTVELNLPHAETA
jgi:hypothetical protein